MDAMVFRSTPSDPPPQPVNKGATMISERPRSNDVQKDAVARIGLRGDT